jgi:threonine aldolase
MRKAMAEKLVANDVYGEDFTMNRHGAMFAKLLGKEGSPFMPRVSMGNLSVL